MPLSGNTEIGGSVGGLSVASVRNAFGTSQLPSYSFVSQTGSGIYYDTTVGGLGLSVGTGEGILTLTSVASGTSTQGRLTLGTSNATGGISIKSNMFGNGVPGILIQTYDQTAYAGLTAGSISVQGGGSISSLNPVPGSGIYLQDGNSGQYVAGISYVSRGTVRMQGDATIAPAPVGILYSGRPVGSKTGAYTVTVNDSGIIWDNSGSVGATTFTLPSTTVVGTGSNYSFFVKAAFPIVLTPNASDAIIGVGLSGLNGSSYTLPPSIGSCVTVTAFSGAWALSNITVPAALASNGINALTIDSSQNAAFAAGLTTPPGKGITSQNFTTYGGGIVQSAFVQNDLGTPAAPTLRTVTGFTTGIYWPTATSIGISTNAIAALTIDSAQNAYYASNAKVAWTGSTALATGSSNGILRITNAADTAPVSLASGIQIGTPTVGASLVYDNGNLRAMNYNQTVNAGLASAQISFTNINTNVICGISIGTASETGMGFPTLTSVALRTNGQAGLNIDSSQNATFSGTLAFKVPNSGALSTTVTVSVNQSGVTFSNQTQTAQTTYNIPAGIVGLRYRFYNGNATAGGAGTKLQFTGSDAMFYNSAGLGANKTATTATLWAIYEIECIAANTWSSPIGANWTLA